MERILITGASGGIGKAVAAKLTSRGIFPAVHARTPERLAGFPGPKFPADLTSPAAVEGVITGATEALGGLDAVIHCAGVGLIKPALDTTDAEFTRVMNINTRAAFLVARESCKVMAAAKRGLFVTIPGILGKAPMRNASAYCASKYAVAGLIKCFAQEFQRSGVRFCLLHLGGVDTPFWNDIGMTVQRDKMIPADTAADLILQALDAPSHLVLSEIVMQPESHQLV